MMTIKTAISDAVAEPIGEPETSLATAPSVDENPPPRVLLVMALPWIFQARLAKALIRVGFHVEAVSKSGHPIHFLQKPVKVHKLGWLREARSVQAAIEQSNPDVIVPCDDPSVHFLHKLQRKNPAGRLSSLIELSIGASESYGTAASRVKLTQFAEAIGVRIPPSTVATRSAVRKTMSGATPAYPLMLKRDGSWGGNGIKIIENEAELLHALSPIPNLNDLLSAARIAYGDRRPLFILERFARRAQGLQIQTVVQGTPANRTVVCRNGEVLGGLTAKALSTVDAAGPSSVIQIIDHSEMEDVARKVVGALKLSGFAGFDFILDQDGHAHLLELNPRAVPVSHLLLAGRDDLAAIFFHAVTGRSSTVATLPVANDKIALFPSEWLRDRNSASLREAHHDVPTDEPGLLALVKYH